VALANVFVITPPAAAQGVGEGRGVSVGARVAVGVAAGRGVSVTGGASVASAEGLALGVGIEATGADVGIASAPQAASARESSRQKTTAS
jgi:hypothetical protein